MVSAQAQEIKLTHIQKATWNAQTGKHLGGYLSCKELDHLFGEVQAGKVQLWNVYDLHNFGNEHVATLCTRTETMYDQTKHLVLIHGGGQWVDRIAAIESYLFQEAKIQGCSMIRAIIARKELAEILKGRFGYADYEFLVAKEVP